MPQNVGRAVYDEETPLGKYEEDALMNFRISLERTLPILVGLFCLPMSAAALPPFDITDPTPRTVVIWIDNNVGDPSSVGNDLEFAFNGEWTSNGTTGTIVVDKDDVIAAFAITGLPGTPADTVNWSDMTITITIATGRIGSISETGTLAIAGLGNQPFSYDLNTDFFDTITSNVYTQTGFADVTFGPETFTGWCTDTNAGQIASLACPPFNGPAPFPYNSSTGRFHAIGGTDLNSIVFAYFMPWGDGQLFEEFDIIDPPAFDIPTLSEGSLIFFGLLLLAAMYYAIRRHGVSG
jgi:hypothetical protein